MGLRNSLCQAFRIHKGKKKKQQSTTFEFIKADISIIFHKQLKRSKQDTFKMKTTLNFFLSYFPRKLKNTYTKSCLQNIQPVLIP